MKSFFTIFFCFIILLIGSAWVKPKSMREYVSNYEQVLGTSMEIKIVSTDQFLAEKAEQAALAEIDRLNSILSSYDDQSEFKRWTHSYNQALPVSQSLFEVLALFNHWQIQTKGALNPSAQVASNLWKEASIMGLKPSVSELKKAADVSSQVHWQLDVEKKTAKHTSFAPLVLNTFVKSYIIHKAAEAALHSESVERVVLNIGGDIVVKGNEAELVEIADPRTDADNASGLETILVKNKAVATSGNYKRGVQIGRKWYSHIVDPRTATPVENIISATVVAEDASTAGAIATAMNVLTLKESLALAKAHPGVDYLIVSKEGHIFRSPNWSDLVVSSPARTKLKEGVNSNFEMLVNLELALIKGQRIHRPFVAVWIENEAKKPVKNIAIWYNKDKWLPDLKNWFRAYGLEYKSETGPIKSTTSATRSPGKYTLKWDGTDDAGNPLKPGTYTVHIEVVREHGTYQIISKKMNFNAKPQKYTFPANDEVASASIEYRKKTK